MGKATKAGLMSETIKPDLGARVYNAREDQPGCGRMLHRTKREGEEPIVLATTVKGAQDQEGE